MYLIFLDDGHQFIIQASHPRFLTQEKKYVSSDRRNFSSKLYDGHRRHDIGFKRGTVPLKRRAPERVITREAVLYGKTDAQEDRPVKKTPQASARAEPTPKTQGVEEKSMPSVEPTTEGHYELSPLMSKLLEKELDDVMAKMGEIAPNTTQSEAEKIVIDTFKNKAGEAMRNTIGLNVTKRLLNVHNPLYVKIVFSAKPARADLVSFLKNYNVSAFKRAGTHGGIFAAKMRNFQDFDELCTSNDLTCGTVRVTVTPCYQFMTCPPNLRTRYAIKEANKNSPTKNSGANTGTANPAEFQEARPVEKETSVQTDSSKQSVTRKVTPTKPNQTGTTKITTDKPTPVEEKQNPAPKVTPAKPTATSNQNVAPKVTQAKPAAANNQNPPKVTPAKPTATNDQKATNKTVAAKPAAASSATKVTPVKPTAVSNQNATPKVMPAAANNQNATPKVTPGAANNQNATPKVTPATANNKNATAKVTSAAANNENATPKVTPAAANNENATPKVTPAKLPTENTQKVTPATPKVTPSKPANSKTVNKPQPAKPAAAKTPAKPKPNQASDKTKVTPVKPTVGKKKQENDYDELDDHDILALISEGIVLDECSGSDDEV